MLANKHEIGWEVSKIKWRFRERGQIFALVLPKGPLEPLAGKAVGRLGVMGS